MATIESKKVSLNTGSQEVFDFVSDLSNLKELLPQDKISDWQGSPESCSFKVAGAYKVGLKHKTLTPPHSIVLTSDDSPIDFDLDISIKDNDGGAEASMVSNLNVNPFMKMMVEKPLKNLFDYIADKLQQKYS